jgi:hypothetical protein
VCALVAIPDRETSERERERRERERGDASETSDRQTRPPSVSTCVPSIPPPCPPAVWPSGRILAAGTETERERARERERGGGAERKRERARTRPTGVHPERDMMAVTNLTRDMMTVTTPDTIAVMRASVVFVTGLVAQHVLVHQERDKMAVMTRFG